jgi:segregation and condensation protein B
VTPKEIKTIVNQLNARYEREQAVYRIRFSEGAWCMELDDTMHSFQDSFLRKNKGVKLNTPTIEVLAIVAYNQPVSKTQIETIRKRPSGAFINQLVRRELLAELPGVSKSEATKYVTTDKFLAFFHLSELKDLPQSHEVEDLDELLS